MARRKRPEADEPEEPGPSINDPRLRAETFRFCACGNLLCDVRREICREHCQRWDGHERTFTEHITERDDAR